MSVKNRYLMDWQKKNQRRIYVAFNKKKDADIIRMLDLQPSKPEYIARLIRKDIAEKQKIIADRRNGTQ